MKLTKTGRQSDTIQFPKIHGAENPGKGSFPVPRVLRADCGGFEPWCLEVFCLRLQLSRETGTPWLILRRDSALAPEGYRITVTEENVQIAASAEQGVVHALTTLYLRMEPDRSLSCCILQDAPRYPHRGQSLDCVRHFFPVEEVKKILDQMCLVKMNVLHLHLTDDQGWRIESKRFPRLHEGSKDYFTQNQLRELVAYARIRGIEILPEIDLPGHTTAILTTFPHLGCTGKKPGPVLSGGIYTTILCAGNQAVYAFLEELLGEICGIFPAKRFHIGGDEAPKHQWMACPRCKAAMETLGCRDFEALQGHFTRQVAEILRKLGKTPVCWNETLKGCPDPEDIQIQYWTLDAPQKMDAYAKAGGSFLYSYMCELYFDYPYSMTNVRKLYNMKPHIRNRRCSDDPGMLGIESALWTEHISDPDNLEEHLFPRMYLVAEKAWSGGHNSYRECLASLRKLCALAEKAGVRTMPESRWNPKGRARQEEALDFFVKMNGGVLEEVPENQAPVQTNFMLMYDYVTRFFRLSDLPKLAKLYFKEDL